MCFLLGARLFVCEPTRFYVDVWWAGLMLFLLSGCVICMACVFLYFLIIIIIIIIINHYHQSTIMNHRMGIQMIAIITTIIIINHQLSISVWACVCACVSVRVCARVRVRAHVVFPSFLQQSVPCPTLQQATAQHTNNYMHKGKAAITQLGRDCGRAPNLAATAVSAAATAVVNLEQRSAVVFSITLILFLYPPCCRSVHCFQFLERSVA